MYLLRSLLFFCILLLFTPPYALLMLLCAPLPHRWRRYSAVPWVGVASWLIWHLLGIRYRVLGREHLPAEPVVILAKHQSAWETIVLQKIFPLSLFVWKKELRHIPFFGWALAVIPMIAVDRNAGRQALKDLVAQGRERLGQGYSVIIFPEGTRMHPGEHGRFQIGGAHMAVRAGVPILPLALNSGEYWGRNAFFKRPGVVTVSLGPLIETRGKKADEVNRQAEAWVAQEMARISPALHAPPAESAHG